MAWFVWFIFTEVGAAHIRSAECRRVDQRRFRYHRRRIFVLREGTYRQAKAEGYEVLVAPLAIGEARNQAYNFALTPLPGRIDFDAKPEAAEVWVDGAPIGTTPLEAVDVAAGEHKVSLRNPRYQSQDITATIDGKRAEQAFAATLVPNWATVTMASDPRARPSRRRSEIGATPAPRNRGRVHELRSNTSGSKAGAHGSRWPPRRIRRFRTSNSKRRTDLLRLHRSHRAPATLNGSYCGETPLEVPLTPGTRYDVRITAPATETAKRQVQVKPNEEQSIQVNWRR